ncbi:hypothetical protein [uncultured Desulfovibrio sp.]|uniref:hypothetical protein n=1 Tax=uncultured Desulfovibrio sp. TaxID=167968 RepID=UPI00260C47A5|nr:hypothetical protein [uncultured Desulfovibrio sp.]
MRVAMQNFTGGEISPILSARYDLARYRNSVACMENMLPGLHGDVRRRPGTRFVAALDSDSVLLPFSFSADPGQNFVLVFGGGSLRIAGQSGFDPAAPDAVLETPYAADELLALSAAQVGDTVYLAHNAHPLHKLIRRDSLPEGLSGIHCHGYAWTLEQVALNTSLPAPAAPSVSFSGSGGSFSLRYRVAAVDASGNVSLASESGVCANARHPSDWVQGNCATISWQAVPEAVEYNVYREEAGYYGFIGIARETRFIDNNYEADTSDTPREDWDPFAEDNHPGVVAFHQQRMVLAGTRKQPQAFYLSRSGDFENFRKSRPLQDDDPLEYLIASGSIDAIAWAASFGDLLIGTSGSEYKAASGDGGPLTPSSISITAQSSWGSAGLAPLIIGNSILHVQRHGAHVRDLFYSLEKDGYAGNDLSILAPHLFEDHTLRQWAYQQTPGSVVWIARDDGLLLAFTYMKEHDIWGWSRHPTAGSVRSVCTLSGQNGDDLWLVTRREINGQSRHFLEALAPQWSDTAPIEEAFFVDCGLTRHSSEPTDQIDGLTHLEGCAVAVLADGSPVEGCVVRDGGITLPYAARTVHVGLPYAAALSLLPLESDGQYGSTLGKRRAYGRCTLRFHRSVGGKYGPSRSELYDLPVLPETWGSPCQPFTGDVDCLPGGAQEAAASLWLVQDRPLPFHLAAVVLDVDFGEN